MTIVKVQRPIFVDGSYSAGRGFGPWLVYDKFRARECTLDTVPPSVVATFNSAPKQSTAFFKQYFSGARWDDESDTWDLLHVLPVTNRRLIW